MLGSVRYLVGGEHGFEQILLIVNDDHITVADLEGEILIEYPRPARGITYVSNGRPPGTRPGNSEKSPKS